MCNIVWKYNRNKTYTYIHIQTYTYVYDCVKMVAEEVVSMLHDKRYSTTYIIKVVFIASYNI